MRQFGVIFTHVLSVSGVVTGDVVASGIIARLSRSTKLGEIEVTDWKWEGEERIRDRMMVCDEVGLYDVKSLISGIFYSMSDVWTGMPGYVPLLRSPPYLTESSSQSCLR